MVCNYLAGSVSVYDVNSVYKGKLIEVGGPISILVFPGGNKVAVLLLETLVVINDIENAVQKNSDGSETIIPRTSADLLFTSRVINGIAVNYFSFGYNFDEVLITTEQGRVFRRCIHADCDSASINTVMSTANDVDADIQGIISIPSRGEYLVVNRISLGAAVYRCSLTALTIQILQNDCKIFLSNVFDPLAIIVDEDKAIVYVGRKSRCNV